MNKWDKYRIEDNTLPSNKWEKYKTIPSIPLKQEQRDSWPALIGKSVLKGLGSIADIPSHVGNAAEGIVNLGRRKTGNPAEVYWEAQNPYITEKPKISTVENAPQTNYSEYIPSTEHLKSAVEKHTGYDLNPNPSSPAQRI